MKIEVTEVHWVDEQAACTLRDLAEMSRLPEAELAELVELGVLSPLEGGGSAAGDEPRFAAGCLVRMRSVRRLREDLELDAQGVSVALALLERIEVLEKQLRALRAQLPGSTAGVS